MDLHPEVLRRGRHQQLSRRTTGVGEIATATSGSSSLANSAMAAPFFLVANAGQLCPCDVYQSQFAAALEVTTLNSIILFYL